MNDQIDLNFPNLLDSVEKEDFKTLLLYLQEGKLINDQDEKGNTALITACETNQTKLVDIILSIGVQVDLANNSKETALTVAAQVGNLSMVELLVAFNADYNHQDEDGRTPLMHAIMVKNMEIMQFLISKGADLELVDKFGMTALVYSLKYFGQKQVEDILDDSKIALLQKQVTQLEEKLSQRQEPSEVLKGDSTTEENSKVIIKDDPTSSVINSSTKIIDPDSKTDKTNKSQVDGTSQQIISSNKSPQIEEEEETTIVKGVVNPIKKKKEGISPEILDADQFDDSLDSIKLSGTLEGEEDKSFKKIIPKTEGLGPQENEKNLPFSSIKGSKNLEAEDEGTMTIKSLNKGDLDESDNLISVIKNGPNLPEIEQKIIKAFEQIPQASKKKRSLKNLKKNELNLEDFSISISNMTDHLDSNEEKTLLKESGDLQEESTINLKGNSLEAESKEKNTIVKDALEGAETKASNSNLTDKNVINETTLKINSDKKEKITSTDINLNGQEEKVTIKASPIDIESKNEIVDKVKTNSDSDLNEPERSNLQESESNEESTIEPEDLGVDLHVESKTVLKSTGVEEAISTKQATKVEGSNLFEDKNDSFIKLESKREAIVEKQKFNLKKNDLKIEEGDEKLTVKGKNAPQEKEKNSIVKGTVQNQEEAKQVLKSSIKKEEPVLVISDPKKEEKVEVDTNVDLGSKLGLLKEKVNETNRRGQSHLMVAAGKGEREKTLLLLDNGADSSMKDFNGFTALMFAAQSGHAEVVKILGSKKADLDVKNAKEFTALSLAVLKNQPECISALIEAGAKKDIKIKGETLLTLAVSNDASKAIKILITLGLDPLEKNRKGRSAIEMAQRLKKKKVVAFFNKYMATLIK